MKKFMKNYTQWIIVALSGSAVFGSLYFQLFGDPVSNIQLGNFFMPDNGYIPCVLCWWQRIFFYPIFIVSLIGIFTKDRNFARYTLVLAAIGAPLSLYHYLIQKFPISSPFECSSNNPCSATEVNYLGFITIPLLALIAFAGVIIASVLYLKYNKKPLDTVVGK